VFSEIDTTLNSPNHSLFTPQPPFDPPTMDAEAGAPLLHGGGGSAWNLRTTFATSLAALLGVLICLMGAFTEFTLKATPVHVDRYYSFLTDVLVMVSARSTLRAP